MKLSKLYLFVISIIILLSTCVLSSCNEDTSTKVGYLGSSAGNQVRASYELFDGTEKKTFRAEKGDRLEFSYTSEVKEGRLEFKIYDPNGDTLATFKAGTTGIIPLLIKKTGRHTIEIIGKKTEGSFSITWRKLEL